MDESVRVFTVPESRFDRRLALPGGAHCTCTHLQKALEQQSLRTMDTPSKNGSYLVIAACILAVISLILSVLSVRSISAMKDQMGDVGNIATRLDTIETASRKASTDADRAVSRLATVTSDAQRSFDNVAKELATLRTAVNRVTIESKELAEKMTSSGGRTATSRPATTASAPPPSSSGSTAANAAPPPSTATTPAPPPAPELGPGGTYTIKAGDTFARLSGRFGVSVQAIEQANPGVDPRRLRIGQAINIPTNP
jgi:LysM repeat protein